VIGLGVRSRLHARQGDVSAALAAAEQLDTLAKISEDPRDPGDAALNRAEIMHLTGDTESAQEMAQQAIEHYMGNGAVARAARARRLAAAWASGNPGASAATSAHPVTAGDGHTHRHHPPPEP